MVERSRCVYSCKMMVAHQLKTGAAPFCTNISKYTICLFHHHLYGLNPHYYSYTRIYYFYNCVIFLCLCIGKIIPVTSDMVLSPKPAAGASQDVVSITAGIAATVTHESWQLGLQLSRQMNAKKAGARSTRKDFLGGLGYYPMDHIWLANI